MKAFLAIVGILGFAFFCPRCGKAWLYWLERTLSAAAQNRWVWVAIVALVLVFSAGLNVLVPFPQPRVHDEFSYLYQADTFAHGRLSSPPHPLWKHFESVHIVTQPRGQILWHPILGVWISTALAIAGVFWMLAAMVPRRWALIGAALAFLNPEVLRWNWSYWGGSVSMLGGALLLGGIWRVLKKPAVAPSLAAGVGMGILCLTRPFEGAVLSLLAGSACLMVLWRKKTGWRVLLSQFAAPAVCATTPFLLALGFYNYRVTGSPLTMPYAFYERTYSYTPIFIWQDPPKVIPHYNNREMAEYCAMCYDYYWQQRNLKGFCKEFLNKLGFYSLFFWRGQILVCLVALAIFRRRNTTVTLAACLLAIALFFSFVGPVYASPRYSAPVFPLLIALVVLGMRKMGAWHWGSRRWGRLAAALLFLFLCGYSAAMFGLLERKDHKLEWQFKRAALLAELEADGKKHLVIVRYGPNHICHNEWVYNRANLDQAKVVWARDLGEESNRDLIRYFQDREVTVIEPDGWGG